MMVGTTERSGKENTNSTASEAALVWRWELNAAKPVLIDASDNMKDAIKDNLAHFERTYNLNRENVQLSTNEGVVRISSKDGTPIPRAFVAELIKHAITRARSSRNILSSAELTIEIPLRDELAEEPPRASLSGLAVQLKCAENALVIERKRYQGEIDQLAHELERAQRGNETLVSRVKEESQGVLRLNAEVKRLAEELKKARGELAGKSTEGALPILADWSKQVARIGGQMTAMLGAINEKITDERLLDLAAIARMSEMAYILHRLKEEIPDLNEDSINEMLNMGQWEQSEVYKRLSPGVKAAQEKIDFLKQLRTAGISIPDSVARELSTADADKAVAEFAQEKARYEERSASAAKVAQFKKEHKTATEFRQVTAPWCDDQPMPILILTADTVNYRLSFPTSGTEDHTFEDIMSRFIIAVAEGNGFSAVPDTSSRGLITITETGIGRLMHLDFTTMLAESLSASGMSEFGLKFEIYALTKAKSTNAALNAQQTQQTEQPEQPESEPGRKQDEA